MKIFIVQLGKKQHYKLGKWLRQRYYDRLFPNGYSADKVYILSTDYDRTIMSAAANLAGLFPPTKKQRWNKHLAWQPMPIHSVSGDEDEILLSFRNPCPLHDKLMKEYTAPFYSQYEQLFAYASDRIGQNLSQSQAFVGLYDTLKVEMEMNREWVCIKPYSRMFSSINFFGLGYHNGPRTSIIHLKTLENSSTNHLQQRRKWHAWVLAFWLNNF